MTLMYIRPANGRQVRFPASDRPGRAGQHVPSIGARVERTMYWIRRLMFGDVVEVPIPTPEPEPVPKSDDKHPSRKARG